MPAASQINIVYIHSHDTGRYLQPYGYAVPTPHLQSLAEEGVLFRKAFCAAPTCSPSRAALLTGQSAHSSGMLGLAHRGFSLYDYNQHILHTLRAAGYHSALAGVEHISGGNPARIGYDQVLGRENAESLAAAWLSQDRREPFFLDVGFGETHRYAGVNGAFTPSGQQGDARYCLPPAPLPDTPETRRDMADFQTAAQRLDAKIGVVLHALENAGLADKTLVIYTTDHGIPFPRMKCSLTDHGMGVALIMRGPGFPAGRVIDAMVSHIDVFPTICAYLQIPAPSWLQGKSMLPLLNGEAAEINDCIFGEVTYHAAYEPKRAVRTQRWKYIRNFTGRPTPVLPNCDRSDSKQLWLDHDWAHCRVAQEELYDLIFDPMESCNLAANPEYAEVKATLSQRLTAWMQHTNDPLLLGDVPLPAGGRTDNPDDIHPDSGPKRAPKLGR